MIERSQAKQQPQQHIAARGSTKSQDTRRSEQHFRSLIEHASDVITVDSASR